MLNVSNQASPFQMSMLTQDIIKVVLSVIMVRLKNRFIIFNIKVGLSVEHFLLRLSRLCLKRAFHMKVNRLSLFDVLNESLA